MIRHIALMLYVAGLAGAASSSERTTPSARTASSGTFTAKVAAHDGRSGYIVASS